jgi:hypothetical protein
MTLRQKRILAILALVDVIVVASLIFAIADFRVSTPVSTRGSRISDSGREYGRGYTARDCQWWATQRLARKGLAGRVTLVPDGPLRFDIIYPPDPTGWEAKSSLAAQSVWTAFDIALGAGSECPTFTQVEVMILATDTNIHASVRTLDLVAWRNGELSENEFIERVTYEVIRDP